MEGKGDAKMAAEIEWLIYCYNIRIGRFLPCLPCKHFVNFKQAIVLKNPRNIQMAFNLTTKKTDYNRALILSVEVTWGCNIVVALFKPKQPSCRPDLGLQNANSKGYLDYIVVGS